MRALGLARRRQAPLPALPDGARRRDDKPALSDAALADHMLVEMLDLALWPAQRRIYGDTPVIPFLSTVAARRLFGFSATPARRDAGGIK